MHVGRNPLSNANVVIRLYVCTILSKYLNEPGQMILGQGHKTRPQSRDIWPQRGQSNRWMLNPLNEIIIFCYLVAFDGGQEPTRKVVDPLSITCVSDEPKRFHGWSHRARPILSYQQVSAIVINVLIACSWSLPEIG